MGFTGQIAKHLREVHFGGNWTSSSLKEILRDVTWKQATTRIHSFNTIAALVYHINYFVGALLKVLQGKPLDTKDDYSFNHPPIVSQEDWAALLEKVWVDAENAARLIEQLPQSTLEKDFADKKYGTYYRNLHGIIEHVHYHLGQIVVIKALLAQLHAHEELVSKE